MTQPKIQLAYLFPALWLFASCSKTPAVGVADGASAGPAGNVCERKLLTADDVTGIVGPPITGTSPLPGDPQTCYFDTATSESAGGPRIMISLRPGLGRMTLESWKSGRMNLPATAIEGVGDGAVWVEGTHEVDAQKNDLLCVAEAGGSSLTAIGLQKKLGGLCNTVFARVSP